MTKSLNRDAVAGLMFMACGGAGLYFGRNLVFGSAADMGPGFFPTLLSLGLIGLGLVVGAGGMLQGRLQDGERLLWRPFLCIHAGIVLFALIIVPLGLAVGVAILVTVAALAGGTPRWREVLYMSLVLLALVAGIFVFGLALPLKMWPAWI